MDLPWQHIVDIVIESQRRDLTCAIKVIIYVFCTLDHEYLFALANLGLDDYFTVHVDDGIGASH